MQPLIQHRNPALDLFLLHNQRRPNHKVVNSRLNNHALSQHLSRDLIHQQRLTRNLIGIRVERLLSFAVSA